MAVPLPRRRLLALGGAAAAVLGLGACGSNTGRPQGSSTPGGGSSGSSGPKPALTQWYHQYGEDGVEAAVKRYAASYPAADVTVKWNPGDYEKAVGSALLTDAVPDIFEYGNGPTLDMIKAGQVLDLTNTLGSARSSFTPAVIAPMAWRDKVWAIPQTVDMQMLYYRSDLLSARGVQPPQTFDELVVAAKAVASKDVGGFFAGNDGGVGVLGSVLIWSAGFDYLNQDQTGIGFDDPAMADALQAFADFANSGAFLQSASNDWSQPDAFVQGETAMMWTGLWNLPAIEAALPGKYGVVPFPRIGPAGRPSVPTGAYSSVVAAKGSDPDAAKAFVKWLWVDQTGDQLDFSQSYGFHIPARSEVAQQADKLKSGAAADAVKMVSDVGHGPNLLWSPGSQQAWTAALSNVVKKGADPRGEIAKVAAKAQAEIKRLNG